jgi:poly(A) polymerase
MARRKISPMDRDQEQNDEEPRSGDSPAAATPESVPPEPGHIVIPANEIARRDVDQNALRVLSRLARAGHEAYLVGGCVRDLLLGRAPKDFDCATSAHPRQIKRLFRNGRIIGRRFRLVHIVYGPDVVETATFRREPEVESGHDGDLLITEDNEYGTAEEDARRRDFTINGLFLDPAKWVVHDWVGGLSDLKAGVLRTIGDPRVRLAEDPVRILRAIKFATRLGFRIEEKTWSATSEIAGDLTRSAPPRVMEEILRLLRSGTALGAFRMLRACGALSVLVPSLDAFLGRREDPDPEIHIRGGTFWRLLAALDSDIHAGAQPTTAVLIAVLFLRVIEQRAEEEPGTDLVAIAGEEIGAMAGQARLARRIAEQAQRIIVNQRRFTQPSSKGFRPLLFLRGQDFPESLHLFRLRSAAWGQGWDIYEGWVERHRRALEVSDEELTTIRSKRRRRRRPRRRKRSD